MRLPRRDYAYQLLEGMGIRYWVSADPDHAFLKSDAPLFGAACLIVLPEKLSPHSAEAYQVLTGMKQVLALKADEVCVAWLNRSLSSGDAERLKEEILKWAPKSILMMGEAVVSLFISQPAALDELREGAPSIFPSDILLQVTYHPQVLVLQKQHKKKAYQDLLNLKHQLDRMSAL